MKREGREEAGKDAKGGLPTVGERYGKSCKRPEHVILNPSTALRTCSVKNLICYVVRSFACHSG